MSESIQWCVREKDVARALGLALKVVRELRTQHLEAGVDWTKDGAAVFYRKEAVAKLRGALGLALTPPPAPVPPEAPKEEAPAELTATVIRFYHNPRILGIRVGDKEGRLRVRDPKNFTRGLECPVRLVAEPDLYELTCRAPRWRGKF